MSTKNILLIEDNEDINLIERVLANLIENALRFVPKGGAISINLKEYEQQVRIQVSDNGVGIPESELLLIFDRFYQLNKNRNVENNTSGLGLAIVKRILELHSSIIKVTSIPNQQTTFYFSLPTRSCLN